MAFANLAVKQLSARERLTMDGKNRIYVVEAFFGRTVGIRSKQHCLSVASVKRVGC